MILEPRMGRITQGTIFCGGYAEDYPGRPVWGLVITARCDTTHEKTPIVNYIPVVTIEDWLFTHGGLLAIDRQVAEVKNQFRNLLVKRQLSTSLLEVHSPEEIADRHFSEPTELHNQKTIKEAKEAGEARAIASCLAEMSRCLSALLPNRPAIANVIIGCRKSVETIVKDLIAHKLSGYYFIPNLGGLTERPSKKGYVALLREVHHMSRMAVTQLVEGISKDAEPMPAARGLCFDCFDFAYPVAELTSPWTEHLMQSFCNLFGRIGVADIDKTVLSRILSDINFKG